MPLLKDMRLDIPEREIAARLQVRNGHTEISERMASLQKKMLAEALALSEPAAVWESFDIRGREDDRILLESGNEIKGASIYGLLDGAASVCLMAATAGPAICTRIRELTDAGDLTSAAFMDAFASAFADAAMDKTEETARYSLKGGRPATDTCFTRRFSPGYGDWDLSAQPMILRLLDTARIGISSTRSHTLLPEKSVTAIMGVFRIAV